MKKFSGLKGDKKMKGFFRVLAFVVCMAVVLTGCKAAAPSSGSSQVSEDGKKQLKIGATFHSTYHEFFAEMIAGMKDEAQKSGVELIISDENQDAAKQNATIETFVQQGCDAIILLATDTEALNAAAIEAMEKGIPVITIDTELTDPNAYITFIGSDGYAMGQTVGNATKEYVEKEMGGKASIGILGWLSNPVTARRADGFKDALKDVEGIKITSEQEADSRDKALSVAENMLQGNPDINLLYGLNEGTTLGSLAAVESQNMLEKVRVTGIDISADVIAAIEAGKIPFIVTQQPETMGRVSIQSCIKAAEGESVEKNIMIPATVVNKDNVADFK